MPGDPASTNDDELLSQIDELKARMDRLMRGGSSTSNSALLTDSTRPKGAEPGQEDTAKPSVPSDPPTRPRVRDLIETEDTELVEVYPGPKEVVPFPIDANPVVPEPQQDVAPPPVMPPKAHSQPKSSTVGGSLISVDDSSPELRPQAASFDDMGNVIQREIAKDDSVPPVQTKKGPDLASRFGTEQDRTVAEPGTSPPAAEEVNEPVTEPEAELVGEVEDHEEYEEELDVAQPDSARSGRSPVGTVAAIWAFTALASGVIATLHFTGIF